MSNQISPHDLIVKSAEKEKSEAVASPQEPEPDLSLDLTEHELLYRVRNLEQELQEAKDTHKLRLKYTEWIFNLGFAWLGLVVLAVFMSGLPILGFDLSDKVLIAFITSTTINVTGLFIVVAKWMFPHNNRK